MAAEAVRLTKETLVRRQYEYDTVKAIYEQMEVDLAPQPRQPAATGTTTKLPLMCAYVFPDDGPYAGNTCTANENGIIHRDSRQAGHHIFVSPAKSKKKSSPKKRAGLPVGCVATLPSNGEICGAFEDNALHYDKEYADYHPFVKPAMSSIPADSAQPPSSANGMGSSSILNSVDETVSAGVAAGGGNE